MFLFLLQNIIGDSNRLYNPDPIDFVVIPHEEVTEATAIDACAVAEEILVKVKVTCVITWVKSRV